MDPAEVQWLVDDLTDWAGSCLVESHSPEALATALSLISELVAGELPQSAEYLAKHKPRRKSDRPYRVIARRSGGRHFDS
jgi:hypothetical protein